MKNIRNFYHSKYDNEEYKKVDIQIYQKGKEFVTSLCFQQEPELGEGDKANNISQYPLEDLLDEFCVFISDFYKDLNTEKSEICYLEFASLDIADIQKIQRLIGKHVYNKIIRKNNKDYIELVIED